MNKQSEAVAESVISHGASALTEVTIDSYNEELRDSEGFVGDRASARAFRAILADERERAAAGKADPIGDVPSEEISKKKLDKVIRVKRKRPGSSSAPSRSSPKNSRR